MLPPPGHPAAPAARGVAAPPSVEPGEAPLRFGYGAAAYYGQPWGEETELQLKGDWALLHPDQPWDDVRDAVRHGWDHGLL